MTELLPADLGDPAGDLKCCLVSVCACHGNFGFSGGPIADGYRESGAVGVVRHAPFGDRNLDPIEGEQLQRVKDPVSAADGFSAVGIAKFPLVGGCSGSLHHLKCEFIDAVGGRCGRRRSGVLYRG